jgi:hypothetical protein
MKIIDKIISISELKEMSQKMFDDMVKAVVDVEKQIMAVDGDLHSDEESLLIENGSKQQDLWGINIYPDKMDEDWIEFNSMINIKPLQNNRSSEVISPKTRKRIIEIVGNLVEK